MISDMVRTFFPNEKIAVNHRSGEVVTEEYEFRGVKVWGNRRHGEELWNQWMASRAPFRGEETTFKSHPLFSVVVIAAVTHSVRVVLGDVAQSWSDGE